jgi:hypothetical protein
MLQVCQLAEMCRTSVVGSHPVAWGGGVALCLDLVEDGDCYARILWEPGGGVRSPGPLDYSVLGKSGRQSWCRSGPDCLAITSDCPDRFEGDQSYRTVFLEMRRPR